MFPHILGRLGGPLLLCLASGCSTPESVAFVRSIAGEVQIGRAGVEKLAVLDQGLAVNDIVRTGDQSKTALQFVDGGVIEVGENSRLRIEKRGGLETSIGALVLEGSVMTTGVGNAPTLNTPFGRARAGAGALGIEVTPGEGIRVLIGELILEADDGGQVTVAAGRRWKVGGIILDSETPEAGPNVGLGRSDLELSPIKVVLLAKGRQVQVRKDGEANWRPAKRRDTLQQGDTVRTRRAAGTLLQFGEGGDLVVHRASQVTLGPSGSRGGVSRARYNLENGSATVRLSNAGGDVGHELMAGDTPMKVFAGLDKARVDISAGRNGEAKVDVRLGRVELADGTTIEAGLSAELGAGQLRGEVRSLAVTGIQLMPGRSTELHYKGSVPPVAFDWQGKAAPAGEPFELQVATDKAFTRLYLRERLQAQRFVYTRWSAGKYFWRVKTAAGWQKGRLKILRHQETNCDNCGRVNDVFNNGEQTTIYYQTTLPAVALRWRAVEGAVRYRVKVFEDDGRFSKPMIDETVTEAGVLTMRLPTGALKEGRYYWLMLATGSANEGLYTGKMNSLRIAYDNAIRDLRIQSPRNGARVRGGSITTRGEVQLGARLSIGGRTVRLDNKFRFAHSVSLRRGLNSLVYKTVGRDGVERFYVREVIRR